MSQVLRQSTQVIVVIGPFVDVGDGFTPETGITLGAADEAELLKGNTGTTTDISAATWAAITGCDGWYALTLSTSHTDTVGALTVMVNDDSVCLPVFARFQVIEEAAYDALYAASADPKADINVATIDAGAITATAIADNAITAAKIADGAIDAATFAAGAITATVIATGAIDADALAADTITAAKVAADVSAEIADAVWDEDATGHQTQGTFGQAIGDPVADTNTIFKAVVTDATGVTVGADVVAVKSDTAAILADTGTDGVIVASLAANSITAGVIANAAIDAATFAADVDAEVLSYLVDDATRIDASALNTAAVTTIPAILVDTAEIGAAGAGLTNINLPNQTMDIAGNITGNLSGSVGSVTGLTAADVAAIKAKTDSLAFTVAGEVDANIQSVNDVTVTGDGQSGTEWGP